VGQGGSDSRRRVLKLINKIQGGGRIKFFRKAEVENKRLQGENDSAITEKKKT
jgi:hypothetical protein